MKMSLSLSKGDKEFLVAILILLIMVTVIAPFLLRHNDKELQQRAIKVYQTCKANNSVLCLCSSDGAIYEVVDRIDGVTEKHDFVADGRLYKDCVAVKKDAIKDGSYVCSIPRCGDEPVAIVSNTVYTTVVSLSGYKRFIGDNGIFFPDRYCSKIVTEGI